MGTQVRGTLPLGNCGTLCQRWQDAIDNPRKSILPLAHAYIAQPSHAAVFARTTQRKLIGVALNGFVVALPG